MTAWIFGRRLAWQRTRHFCSKCAVDRVELRINRRFKRQRRSWTRKGAEHLAQLLWLSKLVLTIGPFGGTKPL
jgi:hypothetical protein